MGARGDEGATVIIVPSAGTALEVGETITGSSSTATGTITSLVVLADTSTTSVSYTQVSGTFTTSDTITGSSSGATRTVSSVIKNNSNPGNVKGGIFLYTFNDDIDALDAGTSMNITLQAQIGDGYTGAKDINLTTTYADNPTGSSIDTGAIDSSNQRDEIYTVSLSEGRDGSTRLAVGMRAGDGYNNANNNSGEVFLFTFADSTDKDFTGGTLAAVIGSGYDNTTYGNPRNSKDKDMSSSLGSGRKDLFGSAVSLDYDSTLEASPAWLLLQRTTKARTILVVLKKTVRLICLHLPMIHSQARIM